MATDQTPETNKFIARSIRATLTFVSINRTKLLRWFIAGLAFMGISTVILYGFVEFFGFALPVATLLTAEASTLLRFLLNHFWVFGQRNPTFINCIHYHIANAGAFTVWWITANFLSYQGMHYLLAGIAAVACSTILSLSSNFFWIWRKN